MIDLLQWPAMLLTIAAAWLVASAAKGKRRVGFWTFLISNVLWIVWGWSTHAWALVVLQVALAIINIRGAEKTQSQAERQGVPDNNKISNQPYRPASNTEKNCRRSPPFA